MKHLICPVLFFLLLSACGALSAEVTPTPEPTPTTVTATSSPSPVEPSPEATPFLSYEDYFAQRIEYMGTASDAPYFPPVGTNVYVSNPEAAPGLALAQELVTEDTLEWIPRTLSYTPDGSLYVFWAGTEEGAHLYRLYYPTKALDTIYTISKEDLDTYYYTPQTEATASLLRCQAGESVCLMGYAEIFSNQEFLWGSYDPAFLALFDDIMTHKEDYPQYEWDKLNYEDVSDLYVEPNSGLTLDLCHYFNNATGEYTVKGDATYGVHDYWWVSK